MDNTSASTRVKLSQQEKKEEESVETDSRGGGSPCPDETSEWRPQNKAGIGGCHGHGNFQDDFL